MPSLLSRIQNLCKPAYVYLVISMIILLVMTFQNVGSNTNYCAGNYSCEVSNTAMLFLIKLLYVIFWTWVLNLICKAGAPSVSWILVLFPIVLMFLFIILFLFSGATHIPSTHTGILL